MSQIHVIAEAVGAVLTDDLSIDRPLTVYGARPERKSTTEYSDTKSVENGSWKKIDMCSNIKGRS